MNRNGPIIIIEDDEDDTAMFVEIFKRLTSVNEVVYFDDGIQAIEYLSANDVKPFLVISDINMPKLDGFQLRDMIHSNEQLRLKCIPYLFFTSSTSSSVVIDAYSRYVQGFFIKPNNYNHLEIMLKKIVDYWQECVAPDNLFGSK